MKMIMNNPDPRDTIRWVNGQRQVLWYRCPHCMALMATVHRIDSDNELMDVVACGQCYHASYVRDLEEEWIVDSAFADE